VPIPKAARTNPSVPHGIAGRRGVVARVSGGGRELETIAVDAEVYMTAQVPWGTEPVGAAKNRMWICQRRSKASPSDDLPMATERNSALG
jgi:hypothetical protein